MDPKCTSVFIWDFTCVRKSSSSRWFMAMELKEKYRVEMWVKLQKPAGRVQYLICLHRFTFSTSFIFLWGLRIGTLSLLWIGGVHHQGLRSREDSQNGSGSGVPAPWCCVRQKLFWWSWGNSVCVCWGWELRLRKRKRNPENYIISNSVIIFLLGLYFWNDFIAP